MQITLKNGSFKVKKLILYYNKNGAKDLSEIKSPLDSILSREVVDEDG
jgi:hypothetical protein